MFRFIALTLFGLATACSDPPAGVDAPIANDGGVDADRVIVDDGTPTRRACTESFGNAITTGFGRLDGKLVAIVDPGSRNCNGGPDHIHLQILAQGKTYDIAVNVAGQGDVFTATREAPLPGIPWQEGWHTGFSMDYKGFGLKSSDFTGGTQAQLTAIIKAELANVNHISVFAVGYQGNDEGTGAHLVHRNGFNNDGLIITQPLSRPSKWRMFRFANQTF